MNIAANPPEKPAEVQQQEAELQANEQQQSVEKQTIMEDLPVVEQQNQDDKQVEQQVDDSSPDFNAFEAAKTLVLPSDKKREVQQPEKKEQQQQIKVEDKQQQNNQQQRQLPENRDYSGIDASLVPHFKRMGNDAFATLKPLFIKQQADIQARDTEITNLKKGIVTIPDSYYDHPAAYVLTPDFEKSAMKENDAKLILQHWESELNNVRQGAKTFKTLARNQQGQLMYGAEMQADANAETALMKEFNAANMNYISAAAETKALQNNYTEKSNQAKVWIKQYSDTIFPAFKDEKSQEAMAVNDFVAQHIPSIYKNHPLAQLLGRSLMSNLQQFKLLQDAKQMMEKSGVVQQQQPAKNGKQPTQQQPRRVNGKQQPTETDFGNDGAAYNPTIKGKEDSVSFDDFKLAKS